MTPTEELYASMQIAFDHFNAELFDGKLPKVLFTTQRQHGMMGYFSAERWTSADGKKCHEIAINPLYVGRATLIELMQTLVHEMAHCWQHCYGKPAIRSYHNKEWADKMTSIGLMPSTTGKPGGHRVGQHMGDYPKPKGKFIHSCARLLNEKQFTLPWVDRFAISSANVDDDVLSEGDHNNEPLMEALQGFDDSLIKQLTTSMNNLFGHDFFIDQEAKAVKKRKVKYTCPNCHINVWGKDGLSIRCDECDELMYLN